MKWSVELETVLLERVLAHKPVGPNAHFHMACILSELTQPTTSNLPASFLAAMRSVEGSLSASALWERVGSLWGLEAVEEEPPFPVSNDEFFLPAAWNLDHHPAPSPQP